MTLSLRVLLVVTASLLFAHGCFLPKLTVEGSPSGDGDGDGDGDGMAGNAGLGGDGSEDCSEGDEQSVSCGPNGRGEQAQVCTEGQWINDSACEDEDECVDDEERLSPTEACDDVGSGLFQPQLCVDGQWTDDGECACGEGEEFDAVLGECACVEGETRAVSTESCEAEGTGLLQAQVCDAGQWEDEGACACPSGEEFDSIASSCVVPLTCNPKDGPFGGGVGTAASPYRICHVEHLQEVGKNPSSHFVLAQSLGIPGGTVDPIGSVAAPFVGVFDGAKRALVGLVLARSGENQVGLFRQVGSETAPGVIRDLKLIDFDVVGDHHVGALVGQVLNANSVVERVSARESSVVGINRIGGLIGNGYGQIKASGFHGVVEGSSSRIGGLIGTSYGSVSDSWGHAQVTSQDWQTGGLMGYNQGGAVTGSWATGDVSGIAEVGGLIGRNDGGSVAHSWATGNITGTRTSSAQVGGLIGLNEGGTVTQSWAEGDVSGVGSDIAGLVGIVNGGTVSDSWAKGNVTGGGGSIGGLVGHSGGNISNSGAEGTVTGAGERVGGLVGHNSGVGRMITGCWATGNVVGSSQHTGGLVGRNSNGTISESWATGAVTGTSNVGGLLGHNTEAASVVTKSWSEGAVTGVGDSVGGLVGGNQGSVSESWASGNVAATDGGGVGGLVGWSANAHILNSWTSGDVSATGTSVDVGGLLGRLRGTSTLKTSYALGTVTWDSASPAPASLGGLVGEHASTAPEAILACYAVAQTFALIGETEGGTAPVSSAARSIGDFATQSNFTGWDFTDVWILSVEAGRPLLR